METNLNHNSIVPLYVQIVEQLNQDIETGIFSQTGRLPTEVELSDRYNVSRITIRRAVDELVNKGLVEKKQGKGTFICSPKLTRRFDEGPISFTEMCEANGLKARAKLLEAGISSQTSAAVREMLGLKEGEPAVRIRRLRYAGDRPLVLEDNFYPLEYSYLLSIDLENDSTYRYLREEKGIELRRTTMKLRIVRADAKTAKLLQVSRNAPQLEMRGRVVRLDGQTVHSSYQVGYGENFEFIVR
ncbi:MAG: GntR family transcriptional regulator [Lawsonibacter sp.]